MNGRFDTPDIARAVRRASAARLAMRKRRRKGAAVAVGLPLTAIIGFAVWTASANGVDVVQAAARHAEDVLELLNQRSPGARTAAELNKTARARPALTTNRTSATPRYPYAPAPPQLADIVAPVDASAPEVAEPFAGLLPASYAGGSVISGPLDSPVAGSPGFSALIPPGSESTASLPGNETQIPLVETPAVPEPQSWALMLLGFALVGWRVRRRQAGGGARLRLAAGRG